MCSYQNLVFPKIGIGIGPKSNLVYPMRTYGEVLFMHTTDGANIPASAFQWFDTTPLVKGWQ